MRPTYLFFAALLVLAAFTSRTAFSQSVVADSVLLQQGIQAMEAGQYEEAIKTFKRLVKKDSLRAETHALLARSFKANGQHINASHHARLAVRHDRDNVDYLIIRYQMGFLNPRPLDKARKRALLKRILELEPDNAFAHTELGREFALLYLHHRDRIQVMDFNPPSSPFLHEDIDVPAATTGTRVDDPFNIELVKAQGYNIIDQGQRAEEAFPKAISHLTTAIRSEPELEEPYNLLMAVFAASENHEDLYRWAKTMKSFRPGDPYSDLYLAYGAYKQGNIEEAHALFQAGIDLLPEAELQVFKDASRIMNNEQIKQVSAEGDAAYWANRDPLNMTAYNERELEHYARLIYSRLLFGEPKLDMYGWDAERGEVYVRYGKPVRMFYMTAFVEDCDLAGSGFATRNGENNITNFHIFDYEGYRFVFGNAGNLAISQQSNTASNVAIPPLNEFPIYSPCASAESSRWSIGANMDYVTQTKNLIKKTPTAYSLPGNTVNFPFLATRFKGESNQAEVWVTYGYPVVKPASSGQRDTRINMGLDTGAFLVAENTGVEAESRKRIASVFSSELIDFEGNTLWPGSHRIAASPGQYTLSVELTRDADNSVGAQTEPLEIPNYASGEFMMSDLMLAYFVEEADPEDNTEVAGVLRRNTVDIHAAPWGLYENGQSVYFYVELYNLEIPASGTAQYTVQALLIDEKQARKGGKRLFRRFRRNKEDGVAVSFEGTSTGPEANQYLIMDTETIPEGNYVLIVRVTDETSGQQAEQQREIFLK